MKDSAPARRRGSRRRRLALGCGCAVVLLAVAAWFLTQEPQLVDHAARVTNVTDYAWIDDHQLLWAKPNSAHLSRIDLRTHAQSLVYGVDTPADARSWTGMRLRSVAPGGHRAIASLDQDIDTNYGSRPYPSAILVGLDKPDQAGASSREYGSGETPVWLPDGRRWLALAEADAKRYYDRNAPLAVWLYSADAPGRKVGPIDIPKATKALLGLTPDSRLVMTDLPPNSAQANVTVWSRGVYPSSAPETRADLRAPAGWQYLEAALSPAGDRIAWVLTTSRVPPLAAFIGRFLPGLVKNIKPARTYQIRTSRLDGRDIRELGFQDAGKANNAVSHLEWNPDGKRVSFVFGENLYVVPAVR